MAKNSAKKRRLNSKKSAPDNKKTKVENNVTTAQAIEDAKYYLESWQKHKADPEQPWSFKKAKQLWILRWLYHADVIKKSTFAIALDYLDGLKGASRERMLKEAQLIVEPGPPEKAEEVVDPVVEKNEEQNESANEEDTNTEINEKKKRKRESKRLELEKEKEVALKLARRKFKRALQVAQRLAL